MQKSTDIISVCALDTHPRTNHSCLSITLRLLRSSTHCQKNSRIKHRHTVLRCARVVHIRDYMDRGAVSRCLVVP